MCKIGKEKVLNDTSHAMTNDSSLLHFFFIVPIMYTSWATVVFDDAYMILIYMIEYIYSKAHSKQHIIYNFLGTYKCTYHPLQITVYVRLD